MNLRDNFKKFFSEHHLRELSRGGIVSFVLMGAGSGAAYIFTLVITRTLGAEAMGRFSLSYTVLYLTTLLGKLGLDSATLRLVAEHAHQDRWADVKSVYMKSFRTMLSGSLVFSIALYFLSPSISTYIFKKPHMAPYLQIAALGILPMSSLFLSAQALRGLKKIRESTFLMNVSGYLFATIFLGAGLFFLNSDYLPLLSYVLAIIVGAILGHILWLRHSRSDSASRTAGPALKTLLSISIPLMLTSSIFYLMRWTDILILSMSRPEKEIGVYAVASRLALMITLPIHAINNIAAPKFAESFGKKDFGQLGIIVKQASRLIFWTSLPIFLLLVLMPSFLLGLFGSEFYIGLQALLILTVGQFAVSFSGTAGHILNMTVRQLALQNIALVALAINIVLNFMLIPRFGINGAAAATAASIIFWNLSAVIAVNRFHKIQPFYFPLLSKSRH